MNLNDFIKKMREYLNTTDSLYVLGKRKELVCKILNRIEKDAQCLENMKPSNECQVNSEKETNQVIEDVSQILKYLQAILNEQAIGIEASIFIDSYSTLIFNWNKNLHKNSDINLLAQTVNRFVNLRLTTVELLQELKKTIRITKEISHISSQPVQLSKHYLMSFDKENNK